jgi:hypothetical protein
VRRHFATAIALLLVVGCSSTDADVGAIDGDDSENATATEEPSPAEDAETDGDEHGDGDGATDSDIEAPPEDEDPFAVPDEIDEAYVERVLNAILEQNSELVREALALPAEPTALPSEKQVRTIAALYGPGSRPVRLSEVEDWVRSEEARSGQLPADEFGTQRFEVERLEAIGPRCVTAIGWYDLTETAVEPFPRDQFGAVVLAHDDSLDRDENPTGWRIWDDVLLQTPDGERLELEEVGAENLAAAVDTDCSDGQGGRG